MFPIWPDIRPDIRYPAFRIAGYPANSISGISLNFFVLTIWNTRGSGLIGVLTLYNNYSTDTGITHNFNKSATLLSTPCLCQLYVAHLAAGPGAGDPGSAAAAPYHLCEQHDYTPAAEHHHERAHSRWYHGELKGQYKYEGSGSGRSVGFPKSE